MKTISTILTSYNRPKMVSEAIESVLSQSYPFHELIIMDDNSNEETKKSIFKYLFDPRIKYFSSNVTHGERLQKCRYSVQINEALRNHVTGDYINYLVDDDLYYPERFKYVSMYLERNPHIDVFYVAEKVTRVGSGHSYTRYDGRRKQEELKKYNWIDHSQLIHSRKCVDYLLARGEGLWDETTKYYNCGDWRFWLKLSAHYKFYSANKVLCEKRYHDKGLGKQISRNKFNLEAVSQARE